MSVAPTTIRVIIPLAIRKRNGRPKILPPTDHAASNDAAVEAHVLSDVALTLALAPGRAASVLPDQGVMDRRAGAAAAAGVFGSHNFNHGVTLS